MHDKALEPIRNYVCKVLLKGKSVDVGEDLLTSGMLDSLAVMSLVSFIEEHCSISVPFDDVVIENFVSINAMNDYVISRVGEHHA